MAQQKSRSRSKKKKYKLEFTRMSLFWGSFGLLFLLSWIFVLGILVGRGLIPESMKSVAELKQQISRLENRLSHREQVTLRQKKVHSGEQEQKFEFFQKLATKKKETANHLLNQKQGSSQSGAKRVKTSSKSPPKGYTVQIASLDNSQNASRLVSKLLSLGYPAYYYKTSVKGKTYYRVRCGRFVSEQEARSLLLSLKEKAKIKGFVCRLD